MLSNLLFTFKDHACDGDVLSVRCPPSTNISIQWAQYGRLKPSSELCIVPHYDDANESTNCLAPNSLQVVLKLCEHQQSCLVTASSLTFGQDPCPHTSKYLDIAFKCQPDNIRVETVCENSVLNLQCPEPQRIAVHSALFGRSRDIQAPGAPCDSQPAYDAEAECQSACAVRGVLKQCHAQRHCSIPATEAVFGKVCQPGNSKYLSVVYACVPVKVLRAIDKSELNQLLRLLQCPQDVAQLVSSTESEGPPPSSSPASVPAAFTAASPISRTSRPALPRSGVNANMAAARPTASGVRQSTTRYSEVPHYVVQPAHSDDTSNGFISDWVQTWTFVRANGEKCTLYFTLSLLLAVVILLLFIICRLGRRRSGRYHVDRPPTVRSMRGVWTTPKGLGLLRESPTLDDSTQSPLYGFDRVGTVGMGEGTGTLSRQSTLSRPSPFQQYAGIQSQRPVSAPAPTPAPPVPIQATVPVASAYPYSSYGDGGSGGQTGGGSVARGSAMNERFDDVDFAISEVQEQQQQQQRLLQPPSWATVSNGRHGHTASRQYFDNAYRR